ncbi:MULTISPECIES: hypothetical protein [unclassified Pseudomonas]|uniref:hypothetical protein n=1 Tax=unclassified Pseudomonas TaxID=196821 RepID=UPI000CD218EE|nr:MULTISPECIES: hypothetical protein [unclassified Pseudomonas]POA32310.1 hypothetical protein C1887_09790 [Pseudomonas sp. GW456-R21]POA68850.1 hypothetical protein C1884_08300 [Pseudomonas sp. GW460-R15]
MNKDQLAIIANIRELLNNQDYSNEALPPAPVIQLLDANGKLSHACVLKDGLWVDLVYAGFKPADKILFYLGSATPGIVDYEDRFTLNEEKKIEAQVPEDTINRLIGETAFALYFVNETTPSNFKYFDVVE